MKICPDCGGETNLKTFEDENLEGHRHERAVVSCEVCDWHIYDNQTGFDEYLELED